MLQYILGPVLKVTYHRFYTMLLIAQSNPGTMWKGSLQRDKCQLESLGEVATPGSHLFMVRKHAEKAVYAPNKGIVSNVLFRCGQRIIGKKDLLEFGFKKKNALGSSFQGKEPGDNQGTPPTL